MPNKIQTQLNPKSLIDNTINPLLTIRSVCKIIKNNLDETLEYLDLISISSHRGLEIIDAILANARGEKINKKKFIYILISTAVKAAMKEYAFANNEQTKLVNVNLKDDFDFKGDETLIILVLFILLRNSLHYKTKIKIWLDSKERSLYFKYGVRDKLESFEDSFISNKKCEIDLGLSFCKKIMMAFDGDIYCEFKKGQEMKVCLRFSLS